MLIYSSSTNKTNKNLRISDHQTYTESILSLRVSQSHWLILSPTIQLSVHTIISSEALTHENLSLPCVNNNFSFSQTDRHGRAQVEWLDITFPFSFEPHHFTSFTEPVYILLFSYKFPFRPNNTLTHTVHHT